MAPWIVAALAGFLLTVSYLITSAGKRDQIADNTPAVPSVDSVTDAAQAEPNGANPDAAVVEKPAAPDRDSQFAADATDIAESASSSDVGASPEAPPAVAANESSDLSPIFDADDVASGDLRLEPDVSNDMPATADAKLPEEASGTMPDADMDQPVGTRPDQPPIFPSGTESRPNLPQKFGSSAVARPVWESVEPIIPKR